MVDRQRGHPENGHQDRDFEVGDLRHYRKHKLAGGVAESDPLGDDDGGDDRHEVGRRENLRVFRQPGRGPVRFVGNRRRSHLASNRAGTAERGTD